MHLHVMAAAQSASMDAPISAASNAADAALAVLAPSRKSSKRSKAASSRRRRSAIREWLPVLHTWHMTWHAYTHAVSYTQLYNCLLLCIWCGLPIELRNTARIARMCRQLRSASRAHRSRALCAVGKAEHVGVHANVALVHRHQWGHEGV